MEDLQNIDHQMSEETLILDGLSAAVRAGRITEDEKHLFLNNYIDKRNAEPGRLARALIEASKDQ